MKKNLQVELDEFGVMAITDIVYEHRMELCGLSYIPLKMSLLRPRMFFPYDREMIFPTIVFLCGGAWIENSYNVWLPEMTWFAKRGYAVASIQYPVTGATRFPDSLCSIKAAIRFLRAHARELKINTDHLVIMGESAGGYLSLLCAATNGDESYANDCCPEQSDMVDAAIALYPPISPGHVLNVDATFHKFQLPVDAENYPSLLTAISEKMPPSMVLHGAADSLVPVSNSELIYERLCDVGVESQLLVLEDAEHADDRFFQESVKEEIISFINDIMDNVKK